MPNAVAQQEKDFIPGTALWAANLSQDELREEMDACFGVEWDDEEGKLEYGVLMTGAEDRWRMLQREARARGLNPDDPWGW